MRVDPLDPLGDGGERPLAGGPAPLLGLTRAQVGVVEQPGGRCRRQGGLVDREPEAGRPQLERPLRERGHHGAAAGARLPGQRWVAALAGDEHVGAGQDRRAAVGVLGAGRVDATAGLGRDERPQRPAAAPVPQEHELESGRRGDQLDERAQDGAALAVPLDRDRRAVLVAGREHRADALGDDRVVARVDLGRLLGGLRRGGEQRVDACPVALERARADGVVQSPVGCVEGGDGQARRVAQRRGGDAGQDRLERVDDVEPALAHGQRDVRAGADRDARAPPPAALAQRHRRRDGHLERLAVERDQRLVIAAVECPQPPPAAAQRPRRGARCEHRDAVAAGGQCRGDPAHVLGDRMGAGERERGRQAQLQLVHRRETGQALAEAFLACFWPCFLMNASTWSRHSSSWCWNGGDFMK